MFEPPLVAAPTPRAIRFRIAYGGVGAFIGISVFFTFSGPPFRNMFAAYLALASGIIAALYSYISHHVFVSWPRQDEDEQALGNTAHISYYAVHSANAAARSPPPASASASAAATSPTANSTISIAGVGSGTEPGAAQPLRPLLHASPYLPALESLRARVCVLRFYRSITYALLAAAVAFCVGFTIVCVLQAQRLTGQSDWMSVVWSFMCAKWAFGIVLHLSTVNPFHPHTIGSGVTTADAPASSTASTALLSAGGESESYRGGGYGSVPARGYADDGDTDTGNTRGGIRAPRSMPLRMDHHGTGTNTSSRVGSRTSSFSGVGGGFPNGNGSLPSSTVPTSSRRVSLSSNGGAPASASTTPISGSYLGGVDAGSDAYGAFASVRPGTTPPLAAHRKSNVVAIGEV